MVRGLRWGSRAALGVWIVAVFAALAPGASVPVEAESADAPRAVARVEPIPEPEPAVEPEPEPAPEASSEPEPVSEAAAPQVLSSSDVRRGEAWLQAGGSFPVIHASYDGLSGFRAYADAMLALGARFVVVSDRRIVGQLDWATGRLGAAALERPFSPRARDYSGEPALARHARAARRRYGGDAGIRLLVPRDLDAGLFGAIARELANRGEGPEAFRQVEGRYRRGADGGLELRLMAAERLDGSRLPLTTVFALSRTAGGSG